MTWNKMAFHFGSVSPSSQPATFNFGGGVAGVGGQQNHLPTFNFGVGHTPQTHPVGFSFGNGDQQAEMFTFENRYNPQPTNPQPTNPQPVIPQTVSYQLFNPQMFNPQTSDAITGMGGQPPSTTVEEQASIKEGRVLLYELLQNAQTYGYTSLDIEKIVMFITSFDK